MKKAYLAGGCFWCIAYAFSIKKGIMSVKAGYSGGDEANPTYEEVKKQKTGHRETIEVTYDDSVLDYLDILEIYFNNVDPLDGSGQYGDKGESYTLAIYTQSVDEETLAFYKLKEVEQMLGRKCWVKIEPLKKFYLAENYHQDYASTHKEEFEKELRVSGRTIK